jgi:hypothetical protein
VLASKLELVLGRTSVDYSAQNLGSMTDLKKELKTVPAKEEVTVMMMEKDLAEVWALKSELDSGLALGSTMGKGLVMKSVEELV